MSFGKSVILACALTVAASSSGVGAPVPAPTAAMDAPLAAANERAVVLVFGKDVLPAVRSRVTSLLQAGAPMPVRTAQPEAALPRLAPDALVLSFGDTAATRSLVDPAALARLGPEGLIVRSGAIAGARLIAAVGNPPAPETADHGNLGTAFAAYALLEELGFAFLHPLAPTLPAQWSPPAAPIDIAESPRWRVRGLHVHTQHPIELTELLQGWGKDGPDDAAGWNARLPEWDRCLEWLLANRQNRVEWVLLWAKHWQRFADGPVRQHRLATLVAHAHARGIAVGADASLALEQQHAYHFVHKTGDLAAELQQIHDGLDWFFGAGFDYYSTESGSTEFTHPNPTRMLAWMNEAARYSRTKYGKPAYIKVHCSTGQAADGYPDPVTGKPINFNFLPHYADADMGVMPHTVQIYGLDDPAPTYGNTDFGSMKDFLEQEVGAREVIWHPETAYWVTYDVGVPLFLPIYAERRLADLRALAADEQAGRMGRGAHAGGRMDGQMIFSSGWEWGYWLNDVVAARAAWNPHLEAGSSREALVAILSPLQSALGDSGAGMVNWIADFADAEHALLIRGEVNARRPADIAERNGMAYLEGFDSWDDIASLGAALGIPISAVTQPQKLGLVQVQSKWLRKGEPDYATEIAPLLDAMDRRFGALAADARALAAAVPAPARDLADDLLDAAQMTALRAHQVHGLYDYAARYPSSEPMLRRSRLSAARTALAQAAKIVAAREPRYRVEAERIAGWRANPTSYEFTYLWYTRSLYFWWRDEGKAVDKPLSPCYLNVADLADIAFGQGGVADLLEAIRDRVYGPVIDCVAAPPHAPRFPQDGLRSRP